MAATPYDYDRDMTDAELAAALAFYARRRALVEEEVTEARPALTASDLAGCHPTLRAELVRRGRHVAVAVAELRDNARAYYDVRLGDLTHERARRQRAVARGAAGDGLRVPDEVIHEIKRRIRLDGAFEQETQTRLGRVSAAHERRGACPFCGVRADPFTVHLANSGDEWYWCHACNQHGDVITLTAEVYELPWRDTVALLAQRCGIDWPPRQEARGSAAKRSYVDIALGNHA